MTLDNMTPKEALRVLYAAPFQRASEEVLAAIREGTREQIQDARLLVHEDDLQKLP